MKKIYIVRVHSGTWDSYHCFDHAIYEKEEDAVKEKDKLQEEIEEKKNWISSATDDIFDWPSNKIAIENLEEAKIVIVEYELAKLLNNEEESSVEKIIKT